MASSKSKTITKNSISLYIRMLVLMLIGLYTSRVVLDVLGVEDFGIYNLVAGIILMSNFLSNALTLSTNRFLAFNIGRKDLQELHTTFVMSVNIHILLTLTILLIAEAIGIWFINTQLDIAPNRLTAANIVYQASLIAFAIQIMGTPYNSDIIVHERMDIYAYISIFFGITKLIIALLLPYIQTDRLIVYGLLMIIPSLIYTIANILYATRYFQESKYKLFWSNEMFIKMATYAGFSSFGNFATAVVGQGQNILLNIFFGPSLNAARALSVQVSNAVTGFINSIYTAVNPQIIKSYAQKDNSYFEQLISYSTLAGYYMLFLMSIPLLFETQYLLEFWLKVVPPHTVIFIQLIIVNNLIYNFATPSWMALQATGQIARIHLVTGSINLMNLLVTYLLWKLFTFEPYSIFVVNIVLSAAILIATLIIQNEQLGLSLKSYTRNILWPVIYSSALCLILPLLIVYFMNDGFWRFIVVTFCSSIWSIIIIYFCGINSNFRRQILSLLHRS